MKVLNYIVIIVIVVFSFPLIVSANIVCNDGTISKSCQNCHRGCCSHHGGCSSNYSDGSSNFGTTNNNSSKDSDNSDTALKEEIINDNNTEESNTMVDENESSKKIQLLHLPLLVW